jgi:outer membrane protein assembly factor BamB
VALRLSISLLLGGFVGGLFAADARWSTYHGDSALRGGSPASIRTPLLRLWRFNAGDPVASTPVAGSSLIYAATKKGRIVALDNSGTQVWARAFQAPLVTNQPPRPESFDAPLLVADEILYAGARGGRLHAMDAASGQVRWSYTFPGSIRGTAAARRNPGGKITHIVVMNQADGTLHGLDPATGALLWKSEPTGRTDGSFALDDDRIVFGNCDSAIHAYSATNGEKLVSIPLGPDCQIAAGLATSNGLAFSGSRPGIVFAANMATGVILWTNGVAASEIFNAPAINGRIVVAGAKNGGLYALEQTTGALRWSFMTKGQPTDPVIASDKVIVCSEGVLHVLNLESGAELWSGIVGDDLTSPAIVDGLIIVGGNDGYITAFGSTPPGVEGGKGAP